MKVNSIRKNMNVIEVGDKKVLFSYETPVAAYVDGKLLRTDTHYSTTTSRHINQFLNGANAETVPQSVIDNLL